MPPKRIFLDSSVILAGLGSETGGSARILRLCRVGIVKGVITKTVLKEVQARVGKFRGKTVEDIVRLVVGSRLAVFPSPPQKKYLKYDKVCEFEDRHVLAGAELCFADFLISLDKKHILKSEVKKALSPIVVCSSKEFLQEHLARILKSEIRGK